MKRLLLLGPATLCLALFIYQGILRPLLAPLVPLPGLPGGTSFLTVLLMLFSLLHASYLLGGRQSLLFFALTAVISWLYEQAGVATGLIFGPYHYTDILGAKLGHVPLLIPLAWFMMIYPSYVIANLLAGGRPAGSGGGVSRIVWLSFLSAMVMTAWDLVVDPILSGPPMRAWIWETGGPYFGIPVQNFAGWMLTTFTVYGIYRSLEHRIGLAPAGRITVAIAAMPIVAYGAMLLSNLINSGLPELVVIGSFAMGLPLVAAAGRLTGLGGQRN